MKRTPEKPAFELTRELPGPEPLEQAMRFHQNAKKEPVPLEKSAA